MKYILRKTWKLFRSNHSYNVNKNIKEIINTNGMRKQGILKDTNGKLIVNIKKFKTMDGLYKELFADDDNRSQERDHNLEEMML